MSQEVEISISKEALLDIVGDFTWCWGWDFFISTGFGNYIWRDPSYNGNNTVTKFDGTLDDFYKKCRIDCGRDKGHHIIRNYCGEDWTLVIPESDSKPL